MTGQVTQGIGARPSLSHRPALDGVRALAVLAVVAFHTGVLHAGWVGVDLFFVLSGYLITGLLAAEVDRSGSVHLRRFWTRRFRRLVPGLVLLLGLTALISWLRLASWRPPTPAELAGAATYTTNWVRVFAAKSYWDMFAGARSPGPFEHTWSLAIEEQFYLVWPVLVWVVSRRGNRQTLLGLTMALLFVTAYLQVLMSFAGASTERLYVGTDTRAPAFLLGACCVLAFDHAGTFARWATWVVPGGLVVLAVACLTMDGNAELTYRGPLLMVSVVGAAVVLGAARLVPGSPAAIVLSWRPLRLLGRWSYGVYLFHWPIAILTLGWASGWARFGVVLTVATVLAATSYELIEHPIRTDGIPRARLVPALAGAVAVLVAVGVVARSEAPLVTADAKAELQAALPSRTAGRAAGGAAGASPAVPSAGEGAGTAPLGSTPTTEPRPGSSVGPSDPAPRPVPSGPITATTDNAIVVRPGTSRLLVIGDSVPYEIRRQLVAGGESRGVLAAVRGAPGCMPSVQAIDQLRNDTRELCTKVRAGFADDVDTFRPDAVLVYYGLSGPDVRSDGDVLDACSAAGRAALAADLSDLISRSATAGAVTYLADPIPPPTFDPIPRGQQLRGWECYRNVYHGVAAAHPDQTRLLDVYGFLCPDGMSCAQKRTLLRDGLHYNSKGAAVAVPWIYGRIFRAA
jgi:peptidoglycan/LPS O-acetylase OafA/YrhL